MNDKKIDSYYEPSWKTSKIEDDIYATKFYVMQKQIDELQQENKQLKNNWNKLREWTKEYEEGSYGLGSYETGLSDGLRDVIKKMQELEKLSK